MATIVSSRDVQEIVSKLSSDKAKAREEGIKLLNTWLEGERSVAFCRFLGQKTAKLQPSEICHSETWPFLVTLLMQCASLEISSSKRRAPKLVYAKTLRIVVQRAHDSKLSGKILPLLHVVKLLFNHVREILGTAPSFHSEYGVILRHLLTFRDYRFHMRMRIYSGLVRLYIANVESSLSGKNDNQYSSREEVFRCILTLQSLLENSPGNFPDSLREDIVGGFIGIFSNIRDEDKLSRKLMDCINKYLLKDGPNLDHQLMEIHSAVQQFVFRCWLTTHDRALKDALTFYARLQLSLSRSPTDRSALVEQLFDVVCKELDQSLSSGGSVPMGDTSKDDKFGILNSSQYGLVELAAAVLYKACANMIKMPSAEKRMKRENAALRLREALMSGKYLWHAAFCCLTRSYHNRIRKDLLIYWFEGISTSFERIMNDANSGHAYEGLLWTLRSLQELSSVLLLSDSECTASPRPTALNEYNSDWRQLWSCLMHGLPIFSNVSAVVDAALLLLCNMISSDSINTLSVPQDIWDLRLFKRRPSVSVLYFISCYFSTRGSLGDFRDILYLRKSLLKAVLGHLNWQESSMLNERVVLLLPAAVYALSAGCVPFKQCHRQVALSAPHDLNLAMSDWVKAEELDQDYVHVLFECSIEVLANIDLNSAAKVSSSPSHSSSHLPRQLREQMLLEMETIVLGALADIDIGARPLSDLMLLCALLSNFIYGSYFVRQEEGIFLFPSKIAQYLLNLLDRANDVIRTQKELLSGCFSYDFVVSDVAVTCFKSFVSSPLFVQREQNTSNFGLHDAVMQSIDRLLKALAEGYKENCMSLVNSHSGKDEQVLSLSNTPASETGPLNDDKSRIMDLELDVNNDSPELDTLTGCGSGDTFSSVEKWKLGMVSLISGFFSVLHVATWNILFQLLEMEGDAKVQETILYNLCQHPYWSTSSNITDMISLMDDMVKTVSILKLDCVNTLSNICVLLRTLSSLEDIRSDKDVSFSLKDIEAQQSLNNLGDLVNTIAEFDHLEWSGRVKLINCICDFILLSPPIGQSMIGRLLTMLRDDDYRVRFSVARRVGVLFQTWDGHEELFQDICSNFGITLVVSSKEKLVTASQALADGPQPRPRIETIIVTLMYLAFHSEKIEVQAVFMMCVISATDPCERELIFAALDNLSRKLQYTNRFKYLEELIGSILFSWVVCGVSLPALVETRQLFVSESEPTFFMQYCCNWLLPSLALHGDSSNLNWVAKIAGQTLSNLVKDHFVHTFAICIGLHCSKTPGGEKAGVVLQNSILHLAKISEHERDTLIKKHMVSIVSRILSLASCLSEPAVPFFSLETVEQAIRTVVDGFLEMDDYRSRAGVVDKINIFRPDRVFMFILELHYKIAAAVSHRHTSHRLAGIEVLIDILGDRVAVASTFNYLLNMSGQFIGSDALQNQCCRIISALLRSFKSNPSKETKNVLEEHFHFLVSKLVTCCVPSKANGEHFRAESSQVLSLLLQLTLDSDPSLHEFISELKPFPEFHIFDEIRWFHEELCQKFSPRQHLLKLVKRSCYVPPRLLLSSLQALHKKVLSDETCETYEDFMQGGGSNNDNDIANAIWTLVHQCGSDDKNIAGALVSDFISRVGIGDPYSVVFHLPGSYGVLHACRSNVQNAVPVVSYLDSGLSDDLLVALLRLLKKYLMDDSVKIVDVTSQALRGILSTERGQRSLQSVNSYERSLIEIHSKGINHALVEKLLSDMEMKFKAEALSLNDSSLWGTRGKTFEAWICPLTYVLSGYCNDVILRLCQEIMFLKAEVTELLLPSIFVNLAGRRDGDIDLQQLISLQVQEHIFGGSNNLAKSIQVVLTALNELRLHYVSERSSVPSKQEISKPSSHGSKSRSTAGKAKDTAATLKTISKSTLWNKVYWLSIDYLVVASSAVLCGSFFTAVMYVEHWCEDHFSNLTLGKPDFSDVEMLPNHIEIFVSAITQINEPDSLYGIVQSHKLTSQIITYEHEGNWGKALESYDLQARSVALISADSSSQTSSFEQLPPTNSSTMSTLKDRLRKPYKGLIRSLQQIGCMHVLDLYCQGLTSRKDRFEHDQEFSELQYEAAWRAGNWDFSTLYTRDNLHSLSMKGGHFNEDLHSCLRALQEGDVNEFHSQLRESKQELVYSVSHASEESTEHIYSSVIKLQILYHLGIAWDLRWRKSSCEGIKHYSNKQKMISGPVIPTLDKLSWLDRDWSSILKRAHLHMDLIEPFIAFRRVLLHILRCNESTMQHLLQSASTLRKGSRFSQAAAFLHEHKLLIVESGKHGSTSYWLGRLEEAKLSRSQGQHEMAINLAQYISQNYQSDKESSEVYRLVGKWLADTRSSNSRTILEKYLKPAVSLAENEKTNNKSVERQGQCHFHLAHYADALFRSHEERLTSNEWQAAKRLRKHKTVELEALIKRLRSSKGDKTDYSIKIQELQKQLTMDKEEAEKLQVDRDNFLSIALEGYKRCLVVGDKYDVKVMFRLVSLWFSLSHRPDIVNSMLTTNSEVQSYKFIPLVYQIASRMGSAKDSSGPQSFQFALVSLLKKMAVDHPYHTIFQLLALANGDRIKDKQRSRNSFVVDMDKKLAAENLLEELSAYHGSIIKQMKQMVEIYIRLAELETRREDTNRRINLPRDLRSLRQLDLVPVVTATFPVDRSCQYHEGSFPHFKGLGDSVLVMNGINAPKVVECMGSDGCVYKQLAKSGNDDLRQDAVMEQCFSLVNTFLQNHRDTWKRRLGVRTYKVVPFTPSAGVLEWVNGTLPLGEYLIGSTRNGGAHGRYGMGDWTFLKCREQMANAKDKRRAFTEVCEKFRPVMHHFFLERFSQPADWFEKRLAYTRSVAASSMVGYIVGLGDRHAMNILIDQATAEVVHIDLGVAFEQGLMLKTPERVPFRLTRDIIDGMGVTGVEGVFRRCCEETLSVMRTNKEALLTIVEVFIHDPLYKWALSPLKALQRQKEMDDELHLSLEGSQDEYEGNKDATRALMRVKQKLDGYEEGEMRSVNGQVQQLIQDAIDPERLCQMFPGWGSWL